MANSQRFHRRRPWKRNRTFAHVKFSRKSFPRFSLSLPSEKRGGEANEQMFVAVATRRAWRTDGIVFASWKRLDVFIDLLTASITTARNTRRCSKRPFFCSRKKIQHAVRIHLPRPSSTRLPRAIALFRAALVSLAQFAVKIEGIDYREIRNGRGPPSPRRHHRSSLNILYSRAQIATPYPQVFHHVESDISRQTAHFGISQ